MAEMESPKVDSKEGIAMLVSFARGGGFVLSAFHAAIAKKYGVSVDGVMISRPIPAILSGSIYKIVSPNQGVVPMAEMDMVERVARALHKRGYIDGGVEWDDGWEDCPSNLKEDCLRVARAAIEAIFKGSKFVEVGGMTVIANPDFQAQYWDGEQMLPVQDTRPLRYQR